MAAVEELIRSEADGSISFGNHTLAAKAKVEDFSHEGDLYKVKTYQTMTKLEKNGMFAYESVPGTSVLCFTESENGVSLWWRGRRMPSLPLAFRMTRNIGLGLTGKIPARCARTWAGSST